MKTRRLGKSAIAVSDICMGTMMFGSFADEKMSLRILDQSFDAGINFFDAAENYPVPPSDEYAGLTEEIVGKWLKTKNRDAVILATKVCGPSHGWLRANQRAGMTALDRHNINRAIESSMKRLGTDYIDLYQTHWQESTTPIEETMAALLKLKEQGKIRAIGVSNASLEQIKIYSRFGQLDTDQERYSMLDQHIGRDGILEHCRNNHIAVLAYSPLEQGLLTGKLTPDRTFPPNDVRYNNSRYTVEKRKEALAMLAEFKPIAERHHATFSQLAIAWTFSQPGLTHVLCGARDAKQAVENAKAGKIKLSAADLAAMNQIIARYSQ